MRTCVVLVVDDEATNRELIASILEADSLAVTQAEDAKGALVLADLIRPDVVILDMVLPDMSGAVLARQIKTRCQATRILAIGAIPTAQPPLIDGDVDANLARPFEIDELRDIVRRLCAASERSDATTKPATTGTLPRPITV